MILLSLLFIKHFAADFPLQVPYMYQNKGKLGHPGGLVHAGVHAFLTMDILCLWTPWFWAIGIVEFIAHYFIDWGKMNLNDKYGWTATNSEYFWWLLGFDQLLHSLCYIVIVWIVNG